MPLPMTFYLPPQEQAHLPCYVQAAVTNRLPFSLLPAIAIVEGGESGSSNVNKNGTRDHGKMQINDVWIRRLAQLGLNPQSIRDDACVAINAAGHIVRTEIDRAGDFWRGVGNYHSRTPLRNRNYAQKVAAVASFLEQMGLRYSR